MPIYCILHRQMKKIFFLLLFLLPLCSFGQGSTQYQAILKALQTEKDSIAKVDLYNQAAQAYWKSDLKNGPDSFRFFAQSAETIARKLNYKKGLAVSLYNLGRYYFSVANNYAVSTPYFLESLQLYEKLDDKIGMANCHLQLGLTSYKLEYYEDAVLNFQKSIQFKENHTATYLLSLSYSEIDSFEKAKQNFYTTIAAFQKEGNMIRVTECYMYLGRLYGKMNQVDSGFYYLNLSVKKINAEKKHGSDIQLVRPYAFLAELYLKKNELDKAIFYAEYSYNISRIHLNQTNIIDAANTLSNAYALKKNYQKAFYYTSIINQIRDSTLDGSLKQKVADMQSKFDFKKKMSDQQLLRAQEQQIASQKMQQEKTVRNSILGGAILLLILTFLLYNRYKIRHKAFLDLSDKNQVIIEEKSRSDKLLRNILPEEVAEELKSKGKAEAKFFESVTVMFTDFKDFTNITEQLSPTELVAEIDTCFKAFDEIISRHNIEKIKTIGDAYMCVGGLPVPNNSHALDVIKAAIEIQKFTIQHAQNKIKEGKQPFTVRIGIHTGSVVAGIVGTQKFAYDIWGDCVNIASRMESSGEAGKINISGTTYEIVKDHCIVSYRGKVMAKNKGEVDMYFVDF